jgi:PIN domain nuclease of toxin-antitoxin system
MPRHSDRPILLDTCALIWLANDQPLRPAARAAVLEAGESEGNILASPISAWEIGQLVSRGRLSLKLGAWEWFQQVLASGVALAPMPPEVLIASSYLPSGGLRDPTDKVLAATARAYRYRLMTRDRPLIDFGAGGHLDVIAC